MTVVVVAALGYVGAASICCCMLPQVHKVFSTRSAKDISARTLGMQIMGNACFVLFSVLSDPPVPQVCVCSSTVLLCVSAIASMKAYLTIKGVDDSDV
ncbi:MAG: hypothetical protein CML51_05935 [Rhodobacteraceae bacterium]|nr:hypothetical protein [Paracoccaceae bacterium]